MKDTSTKHKKTRRFDSDKLFKLGATVAGVYVLVIIVLIVFQLSFESYPIWAEEGLGFVTGTDWNPVEGRESFGVLPYIVGTLVTSAFAMAIGVPLSIGIAMFVTDAPAKIGNPLGFVVELLAAVPSVIYGLWGLYVFRVHFREYIEKPLNDMFGDSVWFFSGTPLVAPSLKSLSESNLRVFLCFVEVSFMISLPAICHLRSDIAGC